ncbi:MAG: inositol-3-phosphate synthase [Pseudomonadota bacterium]
MESETIKIAIVGVGNCASALLQGIEFYKNNPGVSVGLMHYDLGGYTPSNIEVVAAFDIDKRKVGKPLEEAVFSPPNCTRIICKHLPHYGVTVSMGRILDGVSEHMRHYPLERTFLVADEEPCDVTEVLRKSKAEILLNYLPVGSQKATEFYAGCCLGTGVSLINCIPVFIASHAYWSKRFEKRGIPIIGDDIKSQVGATITHRVLTKLFQDRGVKLERTYQLNTGGNTDFLNMLNQSRLKSKKISKTEAVQSQLDEPLPAENIHIGPSDYVPWQNDNKVCFIRMEGIGFAGVPLHLEMRLSVEDSPNSGGVTIDAIRYCRIARERNERGVLLPISAYAMKHPPKQIAEEEAKTLIGRYIAEYEAQKDISLRISKKT